jgi:hypothetical protein
VSPEWFDLWWPAFLSTILGETPVVMLFLRDRIGLVHALALGVALQCITHPLFWLAWEAGNDFFYAHYQAAVIAFVATIYLLEAALILLLLPRRKDPKQMANWLLAALASTTANTASFVLGLLSER